MESFSVLPVFVLAILLLSGCNHVAPAAADEVITLQEEHVGLGWCTNEWAGHILCTDKLKHCIWKADVKSGATVKFAGSCGRNGSLNGPAESALFNMPTGICVTPAGDVIVADSENACLRRISPDGMVDTFAGVCREPGFQDGPAREARFNKGMKEVMCMPNCSVIADDGTAHKLRLVNVAGGCGKPPPSHWGLRVLEWGGGGVVVCLLIGGLTWALFVTRAVSQRLKEELDQTRQRAPLMAEHRRQQLLHDYEEVASRPRSRSDEESLISFNNTSDGRNLGGGGDEESLLPPNNNNSADRRNLRGVNEENLISFSDNSDAAT